jgi:hypothetical protein
MNSGTRRIREPVQREGAAHYVLISVVAFAVTVIATRVFLALTGYPQLGTSTLHIAHVVWGGVVLFVAALLPLVLANRWVYPLGGLLSGIGVGLFIDEVGKFITHTNDYFYPPAAPIIYAVFLLTVVVYLQVRRPPSANARAELYRALEALEDVLDHDLDSAERARLDQRLHRIAATAQHADVRELAHALRTFVHADTRQVVTTEPSRWHQHRSRGAAWLARHITQRRFKLALVAGLVVTGVPGGVALLVLVLEGVLSVAVPHDLRAALLTVGQGARIADHAWAPVRLGIESVTGVPLVIAASLLLLGHDRRGVLLSRTWLVVSLTIGNVLVFYFDQFGAVVDAVLQCVLLVGVGQYQRRYVRAGPPGHHVKEES